MYLRNGGQSPTKSTFSAASNRNSFSSKHWAPAAQLLTSNGAMSSATNKSVPPTPTAVATPKNKKGKKKKKKGANKAAESEQQQQQQQQREDGEEPELHNDDEDENNEEGDDDGDDDVESEQQPPAEQEKDQTADKADELPDRSRSATNGELVKDSRSESTATAADGVAAGTDASTDGDTQARLDALLQDREALRQEVTSLRKALEDIQSKHSDELSSLKSQIESEREEKEQAQEQYETLVGRVNTLRAEIQDRLKEDAEELEGARAEIEALQTANAALKAESTARQDDVTRLTAERDEQSKELSGLRNRANLSQQNWSSERDDLVQREAAAREEFESARQAMHDWEILAVEERSQRQALEEQTRELTEQLAAERDELVGARRDRDTQANAVEGLQKGLQDIQEARRTELREMVEDYEGQLTELRKAGDEAREKEKEAKERLDEAEKEKTRLLPLEAEVKEKNLQVGKLRHEAVILNEHLTKALKQLRKGRSEDTIDRQLVTNHMLQFLSLSHGDAKKYQILQIMAAMLGWTEEQREQAGLARPGASNPNLRAPISPWSRTPSTPTLSAANLGAATGGISPDGSRKESIAGLFSEFLETESQGGSSKATSVSGSVKPT